MATIKEGSVVRCISENFPMIISEMADDPGMGKQPGKHPKVGTFYWVEDVLGDFLLLDAEDLPMSCWWHVSRFRLATVDELLELQPQILAED